MFHCSFFSSLARSRYLDLFSLSFNFTLCSTGTAKFLAGSLFFVFCFLIFVFVLFLFCFFTISKSGHLAEIRFVCILKSHRISCVSLSGMDFGSCIYHLFVWSNLNFLHYSQWITFPTQSCLVLYSFRINLLYYHVIIILKEKNNHRLTLV